MNDYSVLGVNHLQATFTNFRGCQEKFSETILALRARRYNPDMPSPRTIVSAGLAAGGAVLDKLVLPTLQRQHPDWYSKPWVLWGSIAVMAACFAPAIIQVILWFYGLIHRKYGGQPRVAWSIVLLTGATFGTIISTGGYYAYLKLRMPMVVAAQPPSVPQPPVGIADEAHALSSDAWVFLVDSRVVLHTLMMSSRSAAQHADSVRAFDWWHTAFLERGVPIVRRFASIGFKDDRLDYYLVHPEKAAGEAAVRDVSQRMEKLLGSLNQMHQIPPKGIFVKGNIESLSVNANTIIGGTIEVDTTSKKVTTDKNKINLKP
jgi:hypothetical protein